MDKKVIVQSAGCLTVNARRKLRLVKKVTYLICNNCKEHWEKAAPYCPQAGAHDFQIKEVWTNSTTSKALVCCECGEQYGTDNRCEDYSHGRHAFVEIDVFEKTASQEYEEDEKD